MYARILVPIDGSEPAKRGLQEALKLAKHEHARLRLIHVLDEFVVGNASGDLLGPLIDTLRSGGRALLDEAEKLARRAGLEVDSVLVEASDGRAGDHIIRQALAWQADLIVCGTHGRRGLGRLTMGSDAEYIVRRTNVPVLLVRGGATSLTEQP